MENEMVRQVQLRQLNMIKSLHNLCEKNQICYIILGGTMLGAVRHKGFIPWDDDLDIGVPRPDYDRLMKILATKPISGCTLQVFETEEHYTQPFAKLRMDDTIYLETYNAKINMHQGIFVDIFPLDKIPSPGNRWAEMRRMAAKAITFSIWRKEGCTINRKGLKRFERPLSMMLGILPKSLLIVAQKKLVICETKPWHYRGSMFSSNYSTKKVYFTEEDFHERILLDFEDTQLYAPAGYDRVLKMMFKNYMEYPPADRRTSGHDVIEIKV